MQSTTIRQRVDVESYDKLKTLEEKVSFLSQFAELSPSRLNTRPWKLAVTHDQIQIFADFSKRLDAADPYNRELYISLGCVLANLEIAAEHYRLHYVTSLFTGEPAHNLFGVITFDLEQPAQSIYPSSLFSSLLKRHVDRTKFVQLPIEKKDIDALYTSICWIEGVYLYLTNNRMIIEYLAKLTEESEKEQFNSKSFRTEFIRWINRNVSHEGIELTELQLSPISSFIFSVYRDYNIGLDKATHDKDLIQSSPYVAILLSRHDEHVDWVATGVALQVLTLQATDLGIHFHPITSGMEVPYYRDKIKDIIEATKSPQMLVRLGYERSTPPSTTN